MKFTHIFKLLAVAAVGLFVATGCVTTSGMPQADTSVTTHETNLAGPAYLTAYAVTTGYLTEKEKVDEQTQEIVLMVWEIYDSVMVDMDAENFSNVEELLRAELTERLGGRTVSYISSAIRLFDTYVYRIKNRYDFASMKRSEVYAVLSAIHRGIKDGRDDYYSTMGAAASDG